MSAAQPSHWSGKQPNQVVWQPSRDTGYRAGPDGPVCPAFAEIGAHFGGFDLAFIPIWRGGCLSFLSRLGLRVGLSAR